MRLPTRFFATASVLLLALAAPARSQSLIWQNVTDWTAGTTDKTETTSTGNQLHFTYGNSLTGDTVSHYVQSSPAVTNFAASTLVADGGTGRNVLFTAVDFTSNAQGVTLTVTLTQPTTALSFSIFDIDASFTASNNYVDQVRNILGSTNGTTYNIQPAISASASDNTVYIQSRDGGSYTADNSTPIINAITGTASATPQNSPVANRFISFYSATPITSFKFTYGNNTVAALGTVGPADPTLEIIGLSDIAIPEPGTLALAGLGMAGAAVAYRRRG